MLNPTSADAKIFMVNQNTLKISRSEEFHLCGSLASISPGIHGLNLISCNFI